jgi:glutamate synthase (NADPH/NADH) large chain
VREILASLGARSLEEIVGRADLLAQVSRGASHLDDLDLNPMLVRVDEGATARYPLNKPRNDVPDTLDAQIVADAQPFLRDKEKMQLSYTIRNTDRTIGARVSSHIVRRFGMRDSGLQPDHLTINLSGSAGQSLGAFGAPGLKLVVQGDANDYVGKGLSGAIVVVRPPLGSPIVPHENTIVGNTVLYGATAGALFASGQAGERFCVRNSGAKVVVEGCGSNGCEYMTGGMAFVYDEAGDFADRVNPESLVWGPLGSAHWEGVLKRLVQTHARETESPRAVELLRTWDEARRRFVQVCPKEMVSRLAHPLSDAAAAMAGE